MRRFFYILCRLSSCLFRCFYYGLIHCVEYRYDAQEKRYCEHYVETNVEITEGISKVPRIGIGRVGEMIIGKDKRYYDEINERR